MSGLTVDNEEIDPLQNAAKAMTDGDSITAVAWALIDMAMSLRDAQAFRAERAEQNDNLLTNMLPMIGKMFTAGGAKVRADGMACGVAPMCVCGHDLFTHADDQCRAPTEDTVDGVPIQGSCSCLNFKLV